MASGVIKPPDLRASSFVDGVKGGMGIAADFQSIRANKDAAATRKEDEQRKKTADERRKVTEGREDTKFSQEQEDYKRESAARIRKQQDEMFTGYTRAVRRDPEAAMKIRNDQLEAIGIKKRLKAPPVAKDVDGGFEIVEEYDDGTTLTMPAEYVKDAYNAWPSRESTRGDGGTTRAAQGAFDAAVKRLDELKGKFSGTPPPEHQKLIDDAQADVDDKAQQLEELTGARVKPKGKGVGTTAPDSEITALRVKKTKARDAGASAAELQAIEDEITAARTGGAGGVPSASPAPVTTTGPGAAGTATTVERKTKDGKIAIYDATTKEFIRYK